MTLEVPELGYVAGVFGYRNREPGDVTCDHDIVVVEGIKPKKYNSQRRFCFSLLGHYQHIQKDARRKSFIQRARLMILLGFTPSVDVSTGTKTCYRHVAIGGYKRKLQYPTITRTQGIYQRPNNNISSGSTNRCAANSVDYLPQQRCSRE